MFYVSLLICPEGRPALSDNSYRTSVDVELDSLKVQILISFAAAALDPSAPGLRVGRDDMGECVSLT